MDKAKLYKFFNKNFKIYTGHFPVLITYKNFEICRNKLPS